MIPDMYFTDNEYMNLFIEINNLYYDIYNNGGCNFRLDKVTRIKSVVKNFKISKAILLTSHFFPTHTLLLAKTKGFKVFC